jgi:stage V sporulation protein SpoVS
LGEEVIEVATAAEPTNERIAGMLAEVLRELGEVKETQNQLAADLRSVAQQTVKQ